MVTFENRFFTMDYTIETYEEQLNPKVFFRLNRSILANSKAIVSTARHFNGKLKIELKPPLKEEVFVSREKADSFKEWLEHNWIDIPNPDAVCNQAIKSTSTNSSKSKYYKTMMAASDTIFFDKDDGSQFTIFEVDDSVMEF